MLQILCAIYTRLSKEDADRQQNESESIQNQKALLVQYAAERGWDIYRIYCDEDYSGADSLRPDFNRMMEAAREKRFQILLCKSQSRFTRDMELVEKYLHGLFPVWGIRFIAVADSADTEVKGNKKARQINGLVNEWYLEDLSENIRMVFDLKRRQGQYIGGSPIYGYRKDPLDKNHLVADPGPAEVVRQMFRWSLEGYGRQSIARLLNSRGVACPTRYKAEQGWGPSSGLAAEGWSKNTVGRILRNEMYTGVMVQGRTKKASYKSKAMLPLPREQWYRVPGTHEAIVDREIFQAVQAMLDLRCRSDGGGEVHVLSGLVRCMDCGSVMSKTSNGKQGQKRVCYLRCKRYAESREGCTRHSIRLDTLIELVTEQVRRHVQSGVPPESPDIPPLRDTREEALARERSALAARLEKRCAALKSLYLDKASGILGEEQFAELNQAFLAERGRIEQRLAQIDGALAERPPTQAERLERAGELLQLETLPRALAVLLIREIEIGERDIETGEQAVRIHWNF